MREGIFIIFHLLFIARSKLKLKKKLFLFSLLRTFFIVVKLIQHFAFSVFGGTFFTSNILPLSTRQGNFSVSRLNEAQQQYDKCVNMQIANLFPSYFPTFVITFFRLISLFGVAPHSRFSRCHLVPRFYGETHLRMKEFAEKIEIKLKFTGINLCRYLIYEPNSREVNAKKFYRKGQSCTEKTR